MYEHGRSAFVSLPYAGIIFIIASGLVSTNALAKKVTPSASLSISEQVQRQGQQSARDTWGSTELAPDVGLVIATPKIDFNGHYQYRYRAYQSSTRTDSSNQNLSASGNMKLLHDAPKFTGTAAIGQRITDPLGRVGLDSFSYQENQSEVWTGSASVQFQKRLGQIMSSSFTYRYGISNTVDSQISDSETEQLSGALKNAGSSSRVPWGVQFSRNKTIYKTRTSPVSESVSANLGYTFGRTLSLSATGGYEQTDNVGAFQGTKPSGDFWNVSANWTPSRRGRLNVSYGNRFYGETWSGILSLTTRKLDVNVNYSETLSTRPLVEIEYVDRYLLTQSGELIFAPGFPTPTILDTPYIRKNLQGSAVAKVRNGSLTSSLFYETRGFENDDVNESSYGGSLRAKYKLGRLADFSLFVDRRKNNYPSFQRFEWMSTAGATASRALGKKMNISLDGRVLERDSNVNINNQRDYLVSARFTSSL